MADAATGSPKISPHSLKLLLEVRIMDAFSYRALTSWKNRLVPPAVTGKYPISSTISSDGLRSIASRSRRRPCFSASTRDNTRSERVLKYTLLPLSAAVTASEIARCVLPTPAGPMVSFNLPHNYDAVFIGGGAFQLLISNDDVKSCLESICAHLNDAGFLIVDILIPREAIEKGDSDVFQVARDVKRQDGTRSVVAEKYGINLASQILLSEYRYDFNHGEVLTQSFQNGFSLRWYEAEQMAALLKQAGFARVETLSSLPLCRPGTSYVFRASKSPVSPTRRQDSFAYS